MVRLVGTYFISIQGEGGPILSLSLSYHNNQVSFSVEFWYELHVYRSNLNLTQYRDYTAVVVLQYSVIVYGSVTFIPG